jgi:hypothetical protein
MNSFTEAIEKVLHEKRWVPKAPSYNDPTGGPEHVFACLPGCPGCALDRAKGDVERLVEALRYLRNEISGAIGMAEHEMRQILGNTNVRCLLNRIELADEALAPFQPEPAKEDKNV